MNLLQQERFVRLQFPVHKIQAKTCAELFEFIPGLRRYFQKLESAVFKYKDKEGKSKTEDGYKAKFFGHPEDLVKIIRYIVFVYDPDSDLLHESQGDVKVMKEAALREAGFEEREGQWPPWIEEIIEFRNEDVVDWIVDYLKVKKNAIWTEIKFIEEELEHLYRSRKSALIRGEVKTDSMKLIQERLDVRESLYKRFYGEHADLKKATQDELYPVSPENVFKELKIPQDVWLVRQVRDVPKDEGSAAAHNKGSVSGVAATDTEEQG